MSLQRRRAVRKEVIAKVEVAWQVDGETFKAEGIVQDKSVIGLGVQCRKAVPIGTTVTVTQAGKVQYGVAKRCSEMKRSGLIARHYLVGIEFGLTTPASS